jgi:hypothetical protein
MPALPGSFGERDLIPYAWAAGLEPLHLEIRSAGLHPASTVLGVDRAHLQSETRKFECFSIGAGWCQALSDFSIGAGWCQALSDCSVPSI